MDSAPLNSTDQALFANMGYTLLFDVVSVVCETGLWGIYLILFAWVVALQLSRRKLHNLASIVVLAATIILFLSSTALLAMNVSWLIVSLRGFFLRYTNLDWPDRILQINEDVIPLGIPEEALFLANMLVGDAIVIWRAWVICRNTRFHRLVFLPMVLLSASFAFVVINLICLSNEGFGDNTSLAVGARTCQWAEPSAWAVSLLTNIISTSLIAFRAWQHHKFLQSAGQLSSSRSQRIMLIFVESGFVYSLFWLSQLDLFFDFEVKSDFLTYLHAFLNSVGDQISGIYPTAIIILVHIQRSISDDMVAVQSIGNSSSRGYESSQSQQFSTLIFQSRVTKAEDEMASDIAKRSPGVENGPGLLPTKEV